MLEINLTPENARKILMNITERTRPILECGLPCLIVFNAVIDPNDSKELVQITEELGFTAESIIFLGLDRKTGRLSRESGLKIQIKSPDYIGDAPIP